MNTDIKARASPIVSQRTLRAAFRISRYFLIFVFFLTLWVPPAAADQTIGGSCSGGADGAQSANGNNLVCVSGVWKYATYQHGSSSAPCSSTNAGIIQWTGSAFETCNGSNWATFPGLVEISSVTGVGCCSTSSIQFTGLPTTYKTLFLNCWQLATSVGQTSHILFQVGEGGTPTWETGLHYTVNEIWTGAGQSSVQQVVSTTSAGLISTPGQATTIGMTLQAYIDMAGSGTNSMVTYQGEGFTDAVGAYTYSGSSYWNNDTNPITAIQITPNSGVLYGGNCYLYGMN